jgi:hypothetical protein
MDMQYALTSPFQTVLLLLHGHYLELQIVSSCLSEKECQLVDELQSMNGMDGGCGTVTAMMLTSAESMFPLVEAIVAYSHVCPSMLDVSSSSSTAAAVVVLCCTGTSMN